ncbi:ABC transporter permease [Micrococcus sp. IITD107]|uniref:ABC transporter permease n=1 Tax=Micrococcus sp. IITD107 TaxID=3342790 RepID=UPI0035BA3049
MYVIKRVFALLIVLVLSSFAVFGGMYLAPGSPEQFLVQGRTVTPEVLASIRAQYNLDDPFLVRYGNWIGAAVQGDFGQSLVNRQEVAQLLADRLPTTIMLVAYAAVLIVVLGVSLGIVGGLGGGIVEKAVLFFSNLGFAVPTFFAALLLMSIFGVTLGWFPVYGSGEGLLGRLHHLSLPAFALALPSIAVISRVTRTAVVEEKDSEHVQMALARGVPPGLVRRRHIIRNSMLPVTTAVGVHLAALMVGAFVVEYAFTLDGIGSLLVNSIQRKDFAVVQAVALILVTVFGVVNLVVDLLYSLIDPRVRIAGR